MMDHETHLLTNKTLCALPVKPTVSPVFQWLPEISCAGAEFIDGRGWQHSQPIQLGLQVHCSLNSWWCLALQRQLQCSPEQGLCGRQCTQPKPNKAWLIQTLQLLSALVPTWCREHGCRLEQENQMKGFILGHSRGEKMCVKPQRFCSRDQSWNSLFCHACKAGLGSFCGVSKSAGCPCVGTFCSSLIYFFLSTYLTGTRHNWGCQ